MKTALWQHQKDAVEFARTRPGVLLAHDMGAGKSLSALAIIEAEQAKCVLILCPLSVVGVWPEQVRRHSLQPWHVTRLDKGTVVQKTALATGALKSCMGTIVVINHESSWRSPFRELALKTDWDVVVLDEAHRAKAPGGKFSMFVRELGKRRAVRLALTGTPMPHSPLDIYGIARYVDSSVFGTSNAVFRARYAIMGGFEFHEVVGYQNMDDFEKKCSTFMHRVKKEDVLDLPPEVDEVRYCTLEPAARKVYSQLKSQFVAEVDGGLVTASNALVKLLRLQQLTSGCVKSDTGVESVVSTAKYDLLVDALEDLKGQPVVTFCRFRHDLAGVRLACMKLGLSYGEVSGSEKSGLTEQGTMAPVDVVGVQVQSGGVGIDLSRAAVAIYYSVGWSLGDVLQARARLHRPGQMRSVTHLHLVAEDTVDESIMRALEARKDLVEGVLEEISKRQEGR